MEHRNRHRALFETLAVFSCDDYVHTPFEELNKKKQKEIPY